MVFFLASSCGAQFPPAAERPRPTSAPATQPGEFQPGVRIDWTTRRVRVQGRVLDSAGSLEFFACGGGKEHESIVLLEARSVHIFQALGLIGLTPGRPAQWEEATQRVLPAEGDLVDVRVEWLEDGQRREAHWSEWVLDAEFMRKPLALPFVFAGSLIRPDGRLAADVSGSALAVVDMPDALLAPVRSHSDRTSDLWALANRAAIPRPGTLVTLVLGAPASARRAIELDARGEFRVDGRIERAADVAELLLTEAKLGLPAATIQAQGALAADVRRAAASLAALGVGPERVRFERAASAPSSQPAAR